MYDRVSDAAHVVKTEEALKHWDKRRLATDEAQTVAIQNIGASAARMQALYRTTNWMERTGLDIKSAQVLDVGCAQGYGLRPFLLCGFRMDQLHGIDLFADRIDYGKKLTPGMDLRVGDGTQMPYADRSFEIVCEQFCFCHNPESQAKTEMAREMMRVSSKYILIHDWRIGSASKQLYSVSKADISRWFPGWKIAYRVPSQLWPPIGRPLSRFAWPLYDLLRGINPLVGSWMTVLHR